MDDRADKPEDMGRVPDTVRTGPATARPRVNQPSEQIATGPPSGRQIRIEPVFSKPDPPAGAGMFDLSPSSLREEREPSPRLDPPARAGFIAPGTGLLPAGLLPSAAQAPPLAYRTEALAPAPNVTQSSGPRWPESPPTPADKTTPSNLGWYVRKGLKVAAYAIAGWAALVAILIVVYRFADPPLSALMLQRFLTGERITKTWVPIDAMSPSLVRAVLASEDGRFCQHGGIDLEAMQTAIERAGDGTPRGASTISMQVTKNLFLWPSKSYVRKAIEVPLTLAIETFWSKRRIMEIYLNIAEWGPGIFGAEAAAQYHFSKPARQLTDREAALLAVTLPNPFRRDAGDPGPGTRRLAGLIQARARSLSPYQTSCVLVPFKRK